MDLENQIENLSIEGPETNLGPLAVIRTETVLSKLPVHNLAKKGSVNIQIAKHGPDGKVELKWEVSYSDRYGQAGQLAYKLDTIVIDQAIEKAGKPLPERIRLGSLRDICEELGLPEGGRDLNLVKRAFRQNALAGITAKVKYKGNDGTERTLEATFTRYSVIFSGDKFSDGSKAGSVYIELNPIYREVLNNAPIRPLDLSYKKQLSPGAQRFYEIVSYKIFTALKYNQPLARLAYSEYCMFSAQQRYFDYDSFKKQMYKVHRPHVTSGYLACTAKYEETTDEEGQKDWTMFYTPGPKARAEYATFTGKKQRATPPPGAGESEPAFHQRQRRLNPRPLPQPEPAAPVNYYRLVSELSKRGIDETAARKVLSDLPAGYDAAATLEWADQQIASQPRKFTNPQGFYISLLQARTNPPPDFESSQARNARRQAELAQRQAILERQADASGAEAQAAAAAERQLDRLKQNNPGRYRALHGRAKTEFFSQYPHLARFGSKSSAMHEDSIRALMKRNLATENLHQATN